jgi:hypothetical protein
MGWVKAGWLGDPSIGKKLKGVGAGTEQAGGIETWQLKCPNPRHYEHFGIYSYAL